MTVGRKDTLGDGVTLLAAVDVLPDCEEGQHRLRTLDEALCLLTTDVKLSSVLLCQARRSAPASEPSSPAKSAVRRGVLPLSDEQYHILGDSVAQRNFLTDGALPECCGGSLRHDHAAWVAFYQELEPFLEACQSCGRGLASVMAQLAEQETPASPGASAPSGGVTPEKCNTSTQSLTEADTSDTGSLTGSLSGSLHSEQSALCRALSQPALLRLRREGPRALARLGALQERLSHSEDVRLALGRARRLFAEVDRVAVRLEQLGESRRERLRTAARLRALREETTQRHLDKGSDLLEAAGGSLSEEPSTLSDLARSLRHTLRGFSDRLEGTRERLEDTSRCFHLLDRALGWALATGKGLSRAGGTPSDWKQLQHHLMAHPPPDQGQLAEMLQLARKLRNERLLEQCKIAHSRCQETLEQIRALQARVQLADGEQDVLPGGPTNPPAAAPASFPVGRRRSVGSTPPGAPPVAGLPLGAWDSAGTASSSSSLPGSPASSVAGGVQDGLAKIREEENGLDEAHASHGADGSPGSPSSDSGFGGCCSGGDSSPSSGPCSSPSPCSSGCCSCSQGRGLGISLGGDRVGSAHHHHLHHHHHPLHHLNHHQDDGDGDGPERHVLRRSCSWQYAAEPFDDDCGTSVASDSSNVDEHKLGYSSEPSEACPQSAEEQDEGDDPGENGVDRDDDKSSSSKLSTPVPVNSHLHTHASNLSLNSTSESGNPALEFQRKKQKTLLLIMREMIQTERDYVRSLEYVIENYIPELVREDIPQALRGQRNVIFGNIEKIFEFHSQLFLRELERCEKSPLSVGQSFLRHESKFYLYALYNKNKPKSDALMSEYGSIFFKSKQVELGDKMDLASYLLKPVQRMGKYALLLQQLLKSAGAQEPLAQQQQLGTIQQTKGQQQQQGQLSELAEADQMVRFQLRHGNDLLAMDSLRDCDVNVKEQGRLLRQNEFLVWQGKGKKCLRHVFLFEELILFSKARRFPDRKNLDLYIYKHSIKMTDIGLTARLGDNSTRFEIWFRKRKPHDIFTLQAASQDVKQAWTEDISQLLWKQALKNREVRLAEMSSMGIGNKPCLDIRPSADQISDRSVSIAQLSKGPRLRGSPSVPHTEGERTCARRPHSVISVGSSSGASTSTSSSSSNASSSSNSSRSRPGDTSLCSAESGIISDMSEGSGSRWGSGEGRTDDDSDKTMLKRSDLSLSSHIHNSETEDICIKL
ncbi:puratrophin-1-like isoform X2 [Frankliniella occidentalis]|uniref:Puratrophin-1-like isoform X2 n=1 Tax=Frankliniella occidentalis TaxID=133901 RepID=A0A9C6U7D7_FRAOC|nr:puratrophin-1-like isoform X2 [Frankliniella occidentalis]